MLAFLRRFKQIAVSPAFPAVDKQHGKCHFKKGDPEMASDRVARIFEEMRRKTGLLAQPQQRNNNGPATVVLVPRTCQPRKLGMRRCAIEAGCDGDSDYCASWHKRCLGKKPKYKGSRHGFGRVTISYML